MCRHCEILVEDVAHKQVVHDFMKASAAGINRKINEDLTKAAGEPYPGLPSGGTFFNGRMSLLRPVTADDLDLSFQLSVTFWHDNPFNGTRAQQRVYERLQKMWE